MIPQRIAKIRLATISNLSLIEHQLRPTPEKCVPTEIEFLPRGPHNGMVRRRNFVTV